MTTFLLAAIFASDLILGPPEVEISMATEQGRMRCEPSIGAFGDKVLVSWNDSKGGDMGSPSGTTVGWAFSADAGKTYTFGGYLGGQGAKLSGADSRVAATKDGRFLLLVLSPREGIYLYEMESRELGTLRSLGLAIPGKDLDKPALAVDGDRVAVAYTKGTGEICVARSSDGGRLFDRGIRVSEADKQNRSGASLVFNGSTLCAAWMEGEGFAATQASIAVAPQWNLGFEEPKVAHRLAAPPVPPAGQVLAGYRDGGYALFSYDTQLLATRNQIELLIVEGTARGSRVLALRSRDQGASWSEPVEVSALFPAGINSYVAACPLKTEVAALYYHQEAEAADGETNVIMTSLSKDATYSASVSSQPTRWTKVEGDAKRAPFQRVFGDYISVANNGNDELYAAWTGEREGCATIMVRRLTSFPSVRRIR